MSDARESETTTSQASGEALARQAAQVPTASDIVNVLKTIRAMITNGRKDDARTLLRRVIERAPTYEEPWLQLLALDPDPKEEVELLRSFLQHHPHHRYARAFQTRLKDMEIIALLEPGLEEEKKSAPEPVKPPPLRLGDYLIERGWITVDQVEHALQEQQRLERAGLEQRLGTILLRNGYLNQEQLAMALAKGRTVGLGQFGSYLVRHGILTPEQVGRALAYQATIAVEQERAYLAATQRASNRHPPVRKPIPRLGEVMVQMGMLTPQQIEDVQRARETEFNTHFH